MTRIGVIIGLVFGIASAASGDEVLSARSFCVLVEASAQDRSHCEAEYTRSLHLFLRYGEQEGYVDSAGEFSFSRAVRDMWSWRTLVGLPPRSPYLSCVDAAPVVGSTYDFREIWACIAEKDPRAARMDAI